MNYSAGDIAGQDIDSELLVLSDTIKELIQDLGAAKESLLTYICQEKSASFLDDLYMKKKMQEASGISKEVKAEELDSITLLLCISDDPSEAIKPVLTKTPMQLLFLLQMPVSNCMKKAKVAISLPFLER